MPPTVKLANVHFGERDAPIVFGWVMVGHQIGAATAAFGAGAVRAWTGTYTPAFLVAGAFGLVAAVAILAARAEKAGEPAVALA
ncbi:hypothetical protein [Sphingomonas sp. HITSZ_GF]|uniref:hypothetical protein n=1 Tax=Sphingomonas sp. HITSZ_GF TaxID=3037247 RepID=UPI00321FCBA9